MIGDDDSDSDTGELAEIDVDSTPLMPYWEMALIAGIILLVIVQSNSGAAKHHRKRAQFKRNL